MKEIPIINMEGNLNGKIELAMKLTQGSTAYRNDRERPYNGQPHTDNGRRGETEVKGLTMRDITDCFAQGFLAASGNKNLQDLTKEINDEFKNTEYSNKNTWRHDDIYKIECNFDPGAVIQCAMCFIEDMMGIFPNVSKLEADASISKLLSGDGEENI